MAMFRRFERHPLTGPSLREIPLLELIMVFRCSYPAFSFLRTGD
jgi:hypothetical protein